MWDNLDEEGFLYIIDRTKDMIVTGGFNVFPREVEDVLATHPAVGQVAVVGVPDEQWGEAVKAVIVLRPGTEPGPELVQALQALVKQAKGSVQSPKSVDFVDAIPVTPVGKAGQESVARPLLAGQRARGGLTTRAPARCKVYGAGVIPTP